MSDAQGRVWMTPEEASRADAARTELTALRRVAEAAGKVTDSYGHEDVGPCMVSTVDGGAVHVLDLALTDWKATR